VNPITHALSGWCLAELMPSATHRDRAAITLAAIVPDLDGIGIVAELLTRNSADPLLWYTDYHHVLGHNLLFACGATVLALLWTKRVSTAALVFVAVHLHILGDLAGSRGPDGYSWPIPYVRGVELTWPGQWALNAWPNIVITIVLMIVTMTLAYRRGYSIVGLLSRRADEAFIETLRRRVSG
jgi:inner membrane protein